MDFPANFSPDKKWNSCVRRRRWIRYRRYTAQGTWAKVCTVSARLGRSDRQWKHLSVSLQIPLDNPRKPPLPLCDLSCGGWEMSDQSGRYPYLWGVSQQGQVSHQQPCASEFIKYLKTNDFISPLDGSKGPCNFLFSFTFMIIFFPMFCLKLSVDI